MNFKFSRAFLILNKTGRKTVIRDRSLLIVGVGPKRKWLGQEKMLGDQGWVKKKLNSHGGWVKKY
jgi:hypothetical protein